MIALTDALNHEIILKHSPKRIVSLVPSISYTLHRLGLDDDVVGITRFCKFPERWKKTKSIIGGTKDLKIERIKELHPDFIIANKEENTKEQVEALQNIAPVYVSDVYDLDSNRRFLMDMGTLFDKYDTVDEIIHNIDKHQFKTEKFTSFKSVYLIWKEPWMSIGGDTFIDKMMQIAGFENLFSYEKRYPSFAFSKLIDLQPEVLLLSSEPFPFKEKHKEELQKFLPKTKIILVEGEPFTWFGAYAEKALLYFKSLQKSLTHA